MMQMLLRWLVGYRDDLDLAPHWWHRLLTVLWVLAVLALGAWSLLAIQRMPDLREANIETVAALKSYAASRSDLPNAVPAFEALGPVGVLADDGTSVTPMTGLSQKVFCSHALGSYPAEIVAFLQANFARAGGVPVADLQVEDVSGWLAAAEARDGPIEPGSCLDIDDLLPADVNRVVVYRDTSAARQHTWLAAFGYAALVAGLFALVTLNLYYRGLIYTVMGPSGRAPAQSGADEAPPPAGEAGPRGTPGSDQGA